MRTIVYILDLPWQKVNCIMIPRKWTICSDKKRGVFGKKCRLTSKNDEFWND